jgi:hypothetical protein
MQTARGARYARFLRSMQAIRRQAETIPKLPPDVLARIDELIRKIEAAIAAVERVAKLTDIHRIPFMPRVVRRGNVSAPRLR